MLIGTWLGAIGQWDAAGFHLINGMLRHPLLDSVMPFITEKWNFVLPLGLLLLYVMAFRPKQDRIVIICAIVIVLVADQATQLVKQVFQRVRPCHVLRHVHLSTGTICTASFSLPSNHATNMFAAASFLSYNRRWLAVPCFVAAALVGYSRIYVGAHYPIDVLSGIVLGMVLGFTAAIATGPLTRGLPLRRQGADTDVSDEAASRPAGAQPVDASADRELG
jgi:undecaprenyl-diphosphatase